MAPIVSSAASLCRNQRNRLNPFDLFQRKFYDFFCWSPLVFMCVFLQDTESQRGRLDVVVPRAVAYLLCDDIRPQYLASERVAPCVTDPLADNIPQSQRFCSQMTRRPTDGYCCVTLETGPPQENASVQNVNRPTSATKFFPKFLQQTTKVLQRRQICRCGLPSRWSLCQLVDFVWSLEYFLFFF